MDNLGEEKDSEMCIISSVAGEHNVRCMSKIAARLGILK